MRQKEFLYKEQFESIIGDFDVLQQRSILRARDGKVSGWLTVLPLVNHHFDLSAQQFRDGMAIRYKKSLLFKYA